MLEENELLDFVQDYESYLVDSFHKIWSEIKIEHDKIEAYSVIGGLLSRQVTLSIEMARSPSILNGHSAPLFLRSMTDLHIALAWIMLDLEERSKKYIYHGLGEEKLLIELYKSKLAEDPGINGNEDIQKIIDIKTAWINSQRRDFMVEVNLGNWSQLDYRKMSIEADCEDLYKFAYKPFSHCAHNMWPHISLYNSRQCENPLHKYHLIPEFFEPHYDLDYLYRSCKYVEKAFMLFLDKFKLQIDIKLPLDWWHDYFSSKTEKDE